MLKLPSQGYWLTVLGWLIANYLFVAVRFVGLSSVPIFADFDYGSIDHVNLFAKGLVVSFVFGSVTYAVGRAVDVPAFRRRPYSVRVAFQVFTSAVVVTLYLAGLKGAELLSAGRAFTLGEFQSRLFTVNFLVLLSYYSLAGFLIAFVAQMNRILGPGNLRRLFMGEFHHPREVELVLMFLDLKDSTTHAERIGHLKFASFIQDCFMDLAVVADHEAQVYQYVGDEAVLFWELPEGLKNATCLEAYFAFQRQLIRRKEYYEREYGFAPKFKAGVHVGLVTALQVGEMKREFAYLGDTVNTTARIQGKCNDYQESLLISEALLDRLSPPPERFDIDAVGTVDLKGRAQAVNLYRVRERMAAAASL